MPREEPTYSIKMSQFEVVPAQAHRLAVALSEPPLEGLVFCNSQGQQGAFFQTLRVNIVDRSGYAPDALFIST